MILAACRSVTPSPEPLILVNTPAVEATPTPATQAQREVTITLLQEPDELSPLYARQWTSVALRDLWLVGLWNFDDQGRPVPQLAFEIPTLENGGLAPDGLSITIRLNPQATWSDGRPVTSEDFLFTYSMILSEANNVADRSPYRDQVAAVEAQDTNTLFVRLHRPFAGWLTGLFRYVLPAHVLRPVFEAEGTLDHAEWNRRPVPGVGPFVISEWTPGGTLTLRANATHFRPPQASSIRVEFIADRSLQLAALSAGRTDIAAGLDRAGITASQPAPTVSTVPTGFVEGWFFNVDPDTAHPAMLDPRVRRAIALGVDREAIARELLGSSVDPAVTFWDTTPPYHNPALVPYPHDPTEAQRLLTEAGWEDHDGDGIRDRFGVELVLRYATTAGGLRGEIAARAAAQLSALGIGLKPVVYSWDVIWNGFGEGGPLATGQYDIAAYASRVQFPEPDSSRWLCQETPGPSNLNGTNWQGYCNPTLDALFQAQAATLDPASRLEIVHQIQTVLYDEVIWVGLWDDPDVWGVNPDLLNVRLSGITPFWNANEWEWLTGE